MISINKIQLKYIALLAMLLDHIAMFFYSYISYPCYILFRVIGRLAAPIFCYSLVEGYFYTSSKMKYGVRILIFAIISQFAYSYAMHGVLFSLEFNVLVTYFLSFIMLLVYDKIENKALKWIYIIILIALSIPCDWFIYEPLFALIFYLNRENKKKIIIYYSLLVLLEVVAIIFIYIIFFAEYKWYTELWQLGQFLFIPVLYIYDKKNIRINFFDKWIFYIFLSFTFNSSWFN